MLHMQYDRLLASYCCLSVCLSVTLYIVALRVGVGVESCTVVFLGRTSYSLLQILLLYDVSYSKSICVSFIRKTHRKLTGIKSMSVQSCK